jgi:hypothetical protein
MKMLAVLLVGFSVGLSVLAQASSQNLTVDCPKLISDLQGMQKAQQAMMKSFVKKNDTIADALDHMAKDQRNLNGLTLKRSAQTFRQHQVREAQLVSRFETASGQLLDQVEQCLMRDTRLSSNK